MLNYYLNSTSCSAAPFVAFLHHQILLFCPAVSREFVNLAKGYPFWKDANGQQVFVSICNSQNGSEGEKKTMAMKSEYEKELIALL